MTPLWLINDLFDNLSALLKKLQKNRNILEIFMQIKMENFELYLLNRIIQEYVF